MLQHIHQYMKEKPVQSFLIIVVLVLIGYYIYINFFRKENFDLSGTPFTEMGFSAISSYSSSLILCLIIPYIILYYIIKVANKNAIIETSQSKSK